MNHHDTRRMHMAKETLDLDKDLQADRQMGRGHGTDALGPSDRSDSGSDMVGVTDFDSDTDSTGTGERGSVDMDADVAGEDIDTDRVEAAAGAEPEAEEDITSEKTSARRSNQPEDSALPSDNPVAGDKFGHLV
jgi:hypothetical protein